MPPGRRKKKKKGKKQRFQPEHMAVLADDGAAAAAVDGGGAGLPPNAEKVLAKLSSADAESRLLGCNAVGMLCQEAQGVARLGAGLEPIAQQIVTLLTDPAVAVAAEAAGALRNLVDSSPEVCERCANEPGVVVPLAQLLARLQGLVEAGPAPGDEGARQECDAALAGLEHAVFVLWSLGEVTRVPLDKLLEPAALALLFRCLQPGVLPASLVSAAAQCLQTLTEDNPLTVEVLAADGNTLLEHLLSLLVPPTSAEDALFRATIAGIVYNLGPAAPEAVVVPLFEVLAAGLSLNAAGILSGIAQAAAAGDAQAHAKSVVNVLRAQQSSLETLANLCSTDVAFDDGWEDVEGEDAGEAWAAAAGEAASVPGSVIEQVVSRNLPLAVLEKCALLDREVAGALRAIPGAALLEQYIQTQLRALSCLGNMLLVLDLSGLQPADIQSLWNGLFTVGASSPDDEFLESVTGALWSLARRVLETADRSTLAPSREQVAHLIELAASPVGEEARINTVGVLGVVGQLAGMAPDLENLAKLFLAVIGTGNVRLIVEALNSIFDVFAEPPVNEVVVATSMMAALEGLLPALRAQYRAARASLPADLRVRVQETQENLDRFLAYKHQQF